MIYTPFRTNTAAFTLVELLLYVSIIGTLLLAVTGFFVMSANIRVKNQSVSEVNQQGTFAMERMTQTIRNADSISSPATGTTSSSLTLAVATAATSPTVFGLSGTTLTIKKGTAGAVALTGSKVQVTGFSIKNLSRASTPGAVQISLTLSRANPSGNTNYEYSRTFTSTASIRP